MLELREPAVRARATVNHGFQEYSPLDRHQNRPIDRLFHE